MGWGIVKADKLNPELSKREIIRRAELMFDRLESLNRRQVDSINRLLGHTQDEMAPVPKYEHELMDLNDKLAKADVIHTALIDLIHRVRNHAQDTANFKLLEMLGDVGKGPHELADDTGVRASLGSQMPSVPGSN